VLFKPSSAVAEAHGDSTLKCALGQLLDCDAREKDSVNIYEIIDKDCENEKIGDSQLQ
jgi:hypothetical protein